MAAVLRLSDRRIGAGHLKPPESEKGVSAGPNAESPYFPSPRDAHTGLFSWKESCDQADNGFTIFIPCFRKKEEEEDLHLSHFTVMTTPGCIS